MLEETNQKMDEMKGMMNVQGTVEKLQGLMGTFMQAAATIQLAKVCMPQIMEKLQGVMGTFTQTAAMIQLTKVSVPQIIAETARFDGDIHTNCIYNTID